jgi:hypothetical protein
MNHDQITLKGAARPAGQLWPPGGAAAFTLHCPHLGAVEVRIRLDAGGILAAIRAPAGRMAEQAAATLPDLVAGLERATGQAGIASVQVRRGCHRHPTRPDAPAEAGVPVRITLGAPPELYQAVAEALAWAYRLAGNKSPA